jgi:hypothetical protein
MNSISNVTCNIWITCKVYQAPQETTNSLKIVNLVFNILKKGDGMIRWKVNASISVVMNMMDVTHFSLQGHV